MDGADSVPFVSNPVTPAPKPCHSDHFRTLPTAPALTTSSFPPSHIQPNVLAMIKATASRVQKPGTSGLKKRLERRLAIVFIA